MPQTLIMPETKPILSCDGLPAEACLNVSEMFTDTMQGEGAYLGVPASFLRLKGCTLRCDWCDTMAAWNSGARYSIEELLDRLEQSGATANLCRGQHLVITGGSPLLQQRSVKCFLERFRVRFGFLPFVEMENECVLMPDTDLVRLVRCFNNSPKLAGSGEARDKRYKPEVLGRMSEIHRSEEFSVECWFKFVIHDEADWKEIEADFLPLIDRSQIILMPEGASREELAKNRLRVAEIAMRECVRFSDREHIILYDKKAGV